VVAIQELAVMRAIFCAVENKGKKGPSPSYVKKLESALSYNLGNVPVVGTGSGSDSLVLALRSLDIGPGDEVVVPAFGCAVLASSVSWVGAKPIFCGYKRGGLCNFHR